MLSCAAVNFVTLGLVPRIHVASCAGMKVDPRDEPEDDDVLGNVSENMYAA